MFQVQSQNVELSQRFCWFSFIKFKSSIELKSVSLRLFITSTRSMLIDADRCWSMISCCPSLSVNQQFFIFQLISLSHFSPHVSICHFPRLSPPLRLVMARLAATPTPSPPLPWLLTEICGWHRERGGAVWARARWRASPDDRPSSRSADFNLWVSCHPLAHPSIISRLSAQICCSCKAVYCCRISFRTGTQIRRLLMGKESWAVREAFPSNRFVNSENMLKNQLIMTSMPSYISNSRHVLQLMSEHCYSTLCTLNRFCVVDLACFWQSVLWKRSGSSLNKEWKKKYVTLSTNGTLSYHSSASVRKQQRTGNRFTVQTQMWSCDASIVCCAAEFDLFSEEKI